VIALASAGLVAVSRYSAESSGESTWKVLSRRGATLPRIRVGSAPLSRTVTLARGSTRKHTPHGCAGAGSEEPG
jgi:hypothetical protein